MNIIDLLTKAGLAVGTLTDLLAKLKTLAPDLAPEVDAVAALLTTAIAPDNLSAVGAAVVIELKNIAQGKIDPRSHPSDVA